MKKRLMMALVTAALVAAILPGTTSAKESGIKESAIKASCKQGGWQEPVTSGDQGFANQGRCVRVAKRVNDVVNDYFRFLAICTDTDGTFSLFRYGLSPVCEWDSVSESLAREYLDHFCYSPLRIVYRSGGVYAGCPKH